MLWWRSNPFESKIAAAEQQGLVARLTEILGSELASDSDKSPLQGNTVVCLKILDISIIHSPPKHESTLFTTLQLSIKDLFRLSELISSQYFASTAGLPETAWYIVSHLIQPAVYRFFSIIPACV
jgi:hypothetical protein